MKKHLNNTQRNGFKTPDNYFDNFQQKMNIKLDLEKKINKETKVVSISSFKLKYALYAAASVLLLIGVTFSYKNTNTIDTQITSVTDTIQSIKETIQLDIPYYSDDDDDELLALFVEDENIDEYLDDYLIEGIIYQK